MSDSEPTTDATASAATERRHIASPLARRLARMADLDLAGVDGSGPHGRIIKRDIDAALARRGGPSAAGTREQAVTAIPRAGVAMPALSDDKILALYDKGTYEVIPHDKMRKVIAERLTFAKQTIPHYYLSIDCRIDEMLRARKRMNAEAPAEGPRAYKLSVNDFIIKAMALALQQVPAANATWTDGGMLRHKYSDVGVAVAVEGGLFTPVVHQAESKSLSEISNEVRDLAERARKRRLAPHEYQGGTTSISNLGMYGITSFEAVINPPHATILAVGAAERRPVIAGEAVEAATVMSVTLSCDHRVVDGATGAELLAAFKGFIEDPVRMLV
jgi:pyruvate dehydrogenase E2 component (dihydrolipoamide acetyltransferase)